MGLSDEEIGRLDLRGVSDAIAARALTSVEATEAYLRRIERYDPVLRAYITVTADRALARAKAADHALAAGGRRGNLHGVPIALKDLIAVAGVRMTAGSEVLADHVATRDAAVTERLEAAGAVVLGTLSMHEFAFGRWVTDGSFPTGRNPWDITREPGGSSSGAAVAVAAGLCAGALGSDTGGSIRGPAARCGIVGLKPTYGRVSRRGVVPMSWSLDHVGPMTHTVWDSAAMLEVIAAADPGDPSTRTAPPPPRYTEGLEAGVRGVRLGVLRRSVDAPDLHEDVRAATLAVCAELGRQGTMLEDVEAPTLDLAPAVYAPFFAETYEYHRERFRAMPARYRESTRVRLMMGALVSGSDFVRAQRLRARLAREVSALFARVDALLLPAQLQPAQRFEDIPTGSFVAPGTRYTSPWNLLGLPAVVVPAGLSREGLPVAIQIVGRPFDETTVLRIARGWERVTEWHTRHPDPGRWR